MSLQDFIAEIDDTVSTILDSRFQIEISETDTVPNFNDSSITYPNLVSCTQKCKTIETCVLYVDIRDSSKISSSKKPRTLAKIYSSFVYSMIQAGKYFGGHIRNIVGDRVMVVFDQANCFQRAVDTAVLMNTTCQHVLNKRVKDSEFKAGIGIDYGKMLITKTGIIKHASEKEFHRSLVWLGRPANVASKLTDLAYKYNNTKAINDLGRTVKSNKWPWSTRTFHQFFDDPWASEGKLRHRNPDSVWSYSSDALTSNNYPPILMTKAVYDGGSLQNQFDLNPKWDFPDPLWHEVEIFVSGYTGKIFGGDVVNVLR